MFNVLQTYFCILQIPKLKFFKEIVKHAWGLNTILSYNKRFYESLFQSVTNIPHHVIHITNGTIESKVKLTSIKHVNLLIKKYLNKMIIQ